MDRTKFYKDFRGISTGKGYKAATSYSLAIICQLAYEKQAMIRSYGKEFGFSQISTLNVTKGSDIDTQCLVMANDTDIVVAFRGSDDKKDWFANIQASTDPGPFKNGRAHEGFQDALFPTVIRLTNQVDQCDPKGKRIWVTGHSLGGALCSLYSGMLIEAGYEIYGVYTFASPRPADRNFSNALNGAVVGPHFRVVNTGDVVPHVPPEPFFDHCGKRVVLTPNKPTSSEKGWFTERVNALKKFVHSGFNYLDVKDNHVLAGDDESYLPRLKREVDRGS